MGQFKRELILFDLDVTGKDDCLQTMVASLAECGFLEVPDRFLAAVRQRESELSTGIGRGIGIPHARDKGVVCLVTAGARLTHGIEFGAMDGKPVQLVFLTAVPEGCDDEYRGALGRLAAFLHFPEKRERFFTVPDRNGLYELLKEVGI
jgi:mannitol/fructose-specific phosphotransferase system IIA component (Ntr-type)